MMILNEAGQTCQFGKKTFTVGGTVIDIRHDMPALFGTVLALHVEKGGAPMAQCDFEDCGTKCLPLADLMPVSPSVPAETGQLYVLFCFFNSWDDEWASVLAVSSNKCVLIRKMLDDVESDFSIKAGLTTIDETPEQDTMCFIYEKAEDDYNPEYLEYRIFPVPVYPSYE